MRGKRKSEYPLLESFRIARDREEARVKKIKEAKKREAARRIEKEREEAERKQKEREAAERAERIHREMEAAISANESELENETYPRIESSPIDTISGYDFEGFMKNLFVEMGYSAKQTKLSGDMGADLILWEGERKIVVQCKNYTGNVGAEAIQEIVPAVKYYNANGAMVVITSYFTQQAIDLAKANEVELIDKDDLEEWKTQYDFH